MLTKKYYEKLADLINESDGNEILDIWVSSKLIPFLRVDNPKFDKEKFLKRCYP